MTILYQRWKPLARLSLIKNVCENTKPCCSSPKKIGPSRPGHTWRHRQRERVGGNKGIRKCNKLFSICDVWLTHTYMQTYVTVYLTAEAAYAGLADNAEQLRLSGMLVAQEANACLVINAHEARVRCRQGSTALWGDWKREVSTLRQNTELWTHYIG